MRGKRLPRHAHLLPCRLEHRVVADVAVVHVQVEPGVGVAPLLLEIEQGSRLTAREVDDTAQPLREHQDAAVGVDDLGPPVGFFNRLAEANRAVVGQQDHVRALHHGLDRVGKRLAAGRFIAGDRNVAQEHLHLREHRLRDRFAGHGEGRRMRRVAMHDAVHVGPFLHDREMQQNLARTLALPGDLIAVHVDDAEVGGSQEALRHHRRGAEHLVRPQAIGDVTVVAGRKALVVDPPANVADFVLQRGE